MKRLILFLVILLLLPVAFQVKAQDFGTWIELEFEKEFLKDFEFSLVSELRMENQFELNEYLWEGKLTYKPLSFLSLESSYRLGTEIKKDKNQSYTRFAFDIDVSKEIERFETTLRARYTNSAESGNEEPGQYFRPRVKVEYNIKGNKITPYTSYELFQNITEKELTKNRFDVGFTRDIGDLHRIGLKFRLQDYFDDKTSVHILGLDYRLSF